jgi:hypothetical protein
MTCWLLGRHQHHADKLLAHMSHKCRILLARRHNFHSLGYHSCLLRHQLRWPLHVALDKKDTVVTYQNVNDTGKPHVTPD